MNHMDIHEVRNYLPHRFPFLLIDRVVEFIKDERIVTLKNVTINEPYFQGHFPHRPVMPGVLIVETMAQACALLAAKSLDAAPGKTGVYYFVGIDKARFKHPVEPGDQLKVHASIKRKMRGIWMFESGAFVDDELCCSAEIMCTYRDV